MITGWPSCSRGLQSAEKYLKALLEELGIDVEKTHELKSLQTPLLPHHPSLRGLRRGLDFLTNFAVNPRYPRQGRHETSSGGGTALGRQGAPRLPRPPRPLTVA